MFSKLGKYFICFVLFIFVMTITAEAFTAIRQEELGGEKPMTRSQRKMRQRAIRNQENGSSNFSSSSSSDSTPTVVNNESSGGSSSGGASSGNFVKPTETPTPTPTVDKKAEQEKRDKARKTSNTIVMVFILLVIAGLAGWYFTRNVNFKKMKQ